MEAVVSRLGGRGFGNRVEEGRGSIEQGAR